MLFDRNIGTLLDYHLVRVAPEPYCLILVLEGNNVWMEHVGTRGLVCSTKGLNILPDVCEGLLGICRIPLGSVLVVELIFVIALLHRLMVYLVDDPLVDELKTWTKIALNMVEQDKAQQNQSTVCQVRMLMPGSLIPSSCSPPGALWLLPPMG